MRHSTKRIIYWGTFILPLIEITVIALRYFIRCLMARLAYLGVTHIERRSDEWLLGWKVGAIMMAADGHLHYRGAYMGVPYETDDVAICRYSDRDDPIPHFDLNDAHLSYGFIAFRPQEHKCGFYAYYDRQVAYHAAKSYFTLKQPFEFPLLRVALSGYGLPSQLGYRASHQVVTDVWFPNICQMCRCESRKIRPATHIGVGVAAYPMSREVLRSICKAHTWSFKQKTDPSVQIFTFAELASVLGVDSVNLMDTNGRDHDRGEPLIPDTVDQIQWTKG